jgi:LacI family transcriptional regulator
MTAVGTMEALRERGLSVPKDMGLVRFDDVEHLAVLSPFLTVIDQPAETFGSLGAQLLLERMTGKASSDQGASSCRRVTSASLAQRIHSLD